MWLSRAVLALPLLVFLVGAPGATWAPGDASLAVYLERTAAAPLYGLLATVAAYLPVGEPAFRLGLLDALLAAIAIAGIVRAASVLLPKDPVAGVIAAILVAITPALRDAAGPAILAAAAAVWTLAFLLEHARDGRAGLAALASATIVVGSAPWLGVALLVVVIALVKRSVAGRTLAIALAVVGASIAALWSTAIGRLPDVAPALGPLVEAGRGAGAVALGAGLLGTAFGAATALPLASRLALVAGIVAVGVIVTGRDATSALVVLGVGAAAIPAAILRASGATRRHAVAAAAGVPLVLAAILAGPRWGSNDPGDAPARLANDVIGRMPPGPGIVLPTRTTTWAAIHYAQTVAGVRPDLALAPFPPTDLMAADALRADRIVGSDVPAFGRVDPTRSFPRGRGFQFLATPPELVAPVPAPAHYATAVGATEATLLALARARFEAGNGRLDAAARAAGLVGGERPRFAAADLALLATTAPSRARPAMFGFVPPLDHTHPGPWMLELFGDDLAWVAGVDVPRVEQPRERALHALWRDIWLGKRTADDPQIAALGPSAVDATREMLAALRAAPPSPVAPPSDAAISVDAAP